MLVNQLARTPLSKIIFLGLVLTLVRILLLRSKARWAEAVSDVADILAYGATLVFFVLRPFVFQTVAVPSGSMLNTLQIGDYLIINKAVYRYTEPHVGDIVVFRPPVHATHSNQRNADGTPNVDFVKRLVGAPGQTIEIKQGTFFRDGLAILEPYVRFPSNFDFKLVEYNGRLWPMCKRDFEINSMRLSTEPFIIHDTALALDLWSKPAAKIPPGHFLFMGDNRAGSSDGRAWGLVEREAVVGRADLIFLPLGRIGKPASG